MLLVLFLSMSYGMNNNSGLYEGFKRICVSYIMNWYIDAL